MSRGSLRGALYVLLFVFGALSQLAQAQTQFRNPQAGWTAYTDGGDSSTFVYSPTVPSNSTQYRRTVKCHGLEIFSSVAVVATGTVRNVTDVAGVSTGATQGDGYALFVAFMQRGNTTSVLSWRDRTSRELLGDGFRQGFHEDSGFSALPGDGSLYLAGSAFDNEGTDGFLVRATATEAGALTVEYARTMRGFVTTRTEPRELVLVAGMGVRIIDGTTLVCLVGTKAKADAEDDTEAWVACLAGERGDLMWATTLQPVWKGGGLVHPADRMTAVAVNADGLVIVTGNTWGDHNPVIPRNNFNARDTFIRQFNGTTGEETDKVMMRMTIYSELPAVTMDGVLTHLAGGTRTHNGLAGVFSALSTGFPTPENMQFSRGHVATPSSTGASGASARAIAAIDGNAVMVGRTAGVFGASTGIGGPQDSFMTLVSPSGDFYWVRYGGMSGSAELNKVACDAVAGECFGAGTFQPDGSSAVFLQLTRNPLCVNGSRIDANTAYPTTMTSHDICYTCLAGTNQDKSSQTTCSTCPAGTYAPTELTRSCLSCSPGFYNPYPGNDTCTACPLGYSCPGTGAVSPTLALPGQYANETSLAQPYSCAPGTSSSVNGSVTATDCQACPLGHYAPTSGLALCLECPRGSFANATGSSSCYNCPAGSASNVTAMTTGDGCTTCTNGTYSPRPGESVCTPCATGTYQPDAGALSCLDCPARTQANETGMLACTACPIGTASEGIATANCAGCPSGQYQDEEGQGTCKTCPVDTYSMEEGSSYCSACPDNSGTQLTEGSDTILACVCTNNTYGVAGQGGCTACPSWATCNPHDRFPRVEPGSWTRTDVDFLFACQPAEACPGGQPDNLPELNVTHVVVPTNTQKRGVGRRVAWTEGAVDMAVMWTGEHRGDEQMHVMSGDTFTSACLDGYSGEACSLCADGYYRSKGSCTVCGSSSLEGMEALIYTVFVLLCLAGAAALFLYGVGMGTVSAALTHQQKKIMALLGAIDRPTSLNEAAALRALGTTEQLSLLDMDPSRRQSMFVGHHHDEVSADEDTEGMSEEGSDQHQGFREKFGRARRFIKYRVQDTVTGARWVGAKAQDTFGLVSDVTDMDAIAQLEKRPFKERLGSVLSKIIKFAQLSSVLLNIKVEWPSSLTSLGSALQLASFDFNDVVSTQCLTGSSAQDTFVSRYYLRIFLPAGLMALAIVYALFSMGLSSVVECCRKRLEKRAVARSKQMSRRRSEAANTEEEENDKTTTNLKKAVQNLDDGSPALATKSHATQEHPDTWLDLLSEALIHAVDIFVMLFVTVALLAYVTFHSAVVEVFTCSERVSGHYYITAEPSIECFVMSEGGEASPWAKMIPISVLGFIFLSVGIPLMIASIIFSRHPKRHNRIVRARYGMLWSSLREDKYWFEIVFTGFKFVLVMMLPLALLSAGDQLLAMLVILVVSLMVHLFYLPYQAPSDNNMETILLGTVILLDIFGVVLHANSSTSSSSASEMTDVGRELMTSFILLFMSAAILYYIYVLFGGQILLYGRLRNAIIFLRGARERARARYEFWRALREGEYSLQLADGELVESSDLIKDPGENLEEFLLRRSGDGVLSLPENTRVLGDRSHGRVLVVTRQWIRIWKRISEMVVRRTGLGEMNSEGETSPRAGAGRGHTEVTVIAAAESGKSHFAAFLMAAIACPQNLGFPVVDNVMYRDDKGVTLFSRKSGIVRSLSDAEYTAFNSVGAEGEGLTVRAAIAGADGPCVVIEEMHLTQGDRVKYSPPPPPSSCILRVTLRASQDLSNSEWLRAVSGSVSEDSSMWLHLSAWDPALMMRLAPTGEEEQTQAWRQYLLGGALPGVAAVPRDRLRSRVEATLHSMMDPEIGIVVLLSKLRARNTGNNDLSLAALLHQLHSSYPDLLAWEGTVTKPTSGTVPLHLSVVGGLARRSSLLAAASGSGSRGGSVVIRSQHLLTSLMDMWSVSPPFDFVSILLEACSWYDRDGWTDGLRRQLFTGYLVRTLTSSISAEDGCVFRGGAATQDVVVPTLRRWPVVIRHDGSSADEGGSSNELPDSLRDGMLYQVMLPGDVAVADTRPLALYHACHTDMVIGFSLDSEHGKITMYKATEDRTRPLASTVAKTQIRAIAQAVLERWEAAAADLGGPATGSLDGGDSRDLLAGSVNGDESDIQFTRSPNINKLQRVLWRTGNAQQYRTDDVGDLEIGTSSVASNMPEPRQLMTLKQISNVGRGLREDHPQNEEQALNNVLDEVFQTLCEDYATKAAAKYHRPPERFLKMAKSVGKRGLNLRERNAEVRRWITVLARRPEVGSDTEGEMLEEVSMRYKGDVETGQPIQPGEDETSSAVHGFGDIPAPNQPSPDLSTGSNSSARSSLKRLFRAKTKERSLPTSGVSPDFPPVQTMRQPSTASSVSGMGLVTIEVLHVSPPSARPLDPRNVVRVPTTIRAKVGGRSVVVPVSHRIVAIHENK